MKNRDILLYWPLNIEVDLTSLIHTLRKRNRVYLPFMQGDSFKMVPFRLPLTRKKFNIFESGNSIRNIKKIDIAVVPAVGVDSQAKRIGFGKGMYDRFFERLPSSPIIIFTQTKECYIDKAICDDYDIKANVLITPNALHCERRIEHANRSSLGWCSRKFKRDCRLSRL